jgi:hypothetical protein
LCAKAERTAKNKEEVKRFHGGKFKLTTATTVVMKGR